MDDSDNDENPEENEYGSIHIRYKSQVYCYDTTNEEFLLTDHIFKKLIKTETVTFFIAQKSLENYDVEKEDRRLFYLTVLPEIKDELDQKLSKQLANNIMLKFEL